MAAAAGSVIPGATGIILAAGLGSRLSIDGVGYLKPLLPVAGRALIHRTIDSLVLAGCVKIVVVLGHEAETVRGAVLDGAPEAVDLVFETNPEYRLGNGVSVLAARAHVGARAGGRFILMMTDHLVEPAMMDLAGRHAPPADGATLLVDAKIGEVFDLDDATKVQAERGLIADIGKSIERYNCIDTGVFVCSPALMDALAEVHGERGDTSISDGVARLAAAGRMAALDVGDARWQDVDDLAMLRQAETAIAAGDLRLIR